MSDSHPDLDPRTAAALLRQADRSVSTAQGNAGWPTAVFLIGVGAVSSTALAALPWVQDHTVERILFGAVFVWLAVLAIFMAIHLRRAKRGFGLRWSLTVGLWGLLWVVGLIAGEQNPWIGFCAAVGVLVVTVGGAVWELRR